MRRGDVWWGVLPGRGGRRPVVLVTRNSALAVRDHVTVAPIGRRIRGLNVEVILSHEDGLYTECAANLDSLATIPVRRLISYISSLSPTKIQEVDQALRFALGL